MGQSLGGIRPHASERFESFMGVCCQTVNSRLELPTRSNEINWIAEIWNKNNWLPTLDDFRTLATDGGDPVNPYVVHGALLSHRP
jgi:hypothetical protein